MANKTVWKVGVWVLLAVASFAGRVHATEDQNLNGVWQCHFLKANNDNIFESSYYSNWTFEAEKKRVHIFYSPVHKGFLYDYRWDGKQLVIGDPSDSLWITFYTHQTHMQTGGALVIEDPQLRWKGWLCHRQPTEQWPPDGLQFLDYSRYPWLSGLVEDGWEKEKYRNPKLYEEWRKGWSR
ncbi:MAG: hypothetical protein IPL99_08835 [Candidatus Competibacteraceae bacterium]|nr:hypothetical protein [Candidatus Competibacteraceae bacterium]